MNIAFCSSEVAPFAKTGGLADVCGSLPEALVSQGCAVKVFMPWYKDIKPQQNFPAYGYTKEKGVEFYFIRHDQYFWRDGLYGNKVGDYVDNIERFSFLCEKIFEVIKQIEWSPDILHINDWQTSLAGIYLKVKHGANPLFKKTKIALTIHNIAYQGVFLKERFGVLGISWDYFNLHSLEFYDQINLLKGGIVFSDVINTVSPTYAKQIQTKDYGCGLDGVLREKRHCLSGILNAIDYNIWNPAKDKFIKRKYSIKSLSAKAINKAKFQTEFDLKPDAKGLLLAMVGRLSEQKGLDILVSALPTLLRYGQVVILGTGQQQYHHQLRHLENQSRGRLRVILKFDEAIAHKLYAASDAFLMPSRFEPCGLAQMISYAYGSLPIVHATGGLIDTVLDVNHGGCGFMFGHYSSSGLIRCLERAHEVYQNKKKWTEVVKQAMVKKFCWQDTALAYIQMYKKALKKTKLSW